ncbi:MAG: YggS family pyridoxal phosphate-dependent enzyme [candidate division WOR-3 bacterium]
MSVRENLELLEERIAAACVRAERKRSEVRLIAVAKTKPAELVNEAIAAGVRDIGENRVQEAVAKRPLVAAGCRWHLVGNLQTNKAKKAVEVFDMIQSVDSARLALELQKRCEQAGRRMPVLIEVNTSGEPTKHGVSPEELPALVEMVIGLPMLNLKGLMTIGPGLAVEDPEASRQCFRMLRRLAVECRERFGVALPELSMGMTSDFEVGIEEGATMIRIGTALFGVRQ